MLKVPKNGMSRLERLGVKHFRFSHLCTYAFSCKKHKTAAIAATREGECAESQGEL